MKRIALIAIAAIMVAACGQPSSRNEVSVNPSEYTSKNQDNMQRVRDFLHAAGVYFLATVDGDTAVYFLKDAKATISSFTAEPIEIDF